jgi:S-layer protein
MAITAAERTQIIELTTLMFNAAPGAFYLSQIVAVYESNGRSLQTLANILGSTPVYQSLNPNFQTAAEFAADLLTPLGLQNDTFATSFIVSRFNAGQSKASIVFQAFTALNGVTATDAAQYQAAKAALLNKTAVAEYYSVTKEGAATDLVTLQGVVGGVTDVAATVDAAKAAVDALVISGQVFTLTTGIDTIVGTAGNDTIVAVLDDTTPANATFTNLDSIDGGAGNADTLQLNDLDTAGSGFPAGTSLKNVEIAVVRGAGVVNVDTSTAVGLTKVQVTQATDATVNAAGTTAVEVTGAGGTITVDGGSSQTVTSSTSGAAITLGATTVSTGAISVTHSKQAGATIGVDGGSSVSVTASGVTTGAVNIGQGGAASDLPSGAVTVTSTGAASVAGTDVTHGAISVTGGTTVTVNQTATSSSAAAAADLAGATITQSAVNVTGGAATTSVTVLESPAVAEVLAVAAVAGVTETNVITFSALTAGQDTNIGGLIFTASKDLTAAQVAAAYANLSAGTTQGSAPASNGVYTGQLVAGWTSGAVVAAGANSTVTVSSTTQTNAVDLVTTAGTVDMATVTTQGSAATAAKAGVLGVVGGAVTVNGNITGADVLTTVTLGGYGATTVASDALNTLTLANSNQSVGVTNATATTLALSLSGVGVSTANAAVNLGGTYTTLNVSATGANSDVDLTAGGATALNLSGDKALVLTGSTLGALKTITITGAAGLTATDIAAGAAVTSVNASGTSGNNTLSIDASKATYTGGTGADVVTLTSTTVSKAVALGAGDDSVTLASGTTALTANVTGDAGTDTLVMASLDAETVSAAATFETKIDGFEKLSLGAVLLAQADTIDLANMDDISYVISAGGAVGSSLVLNSMAGGGTLELTGAGTLADVNLTDATGTADVFNVVTKVGAADINFGSVDLSGVETVNLTATDTSTTAAINVATLSVLDTAVKAITITGNSALVLTTNSNVLSSVNGSAMTGALTASTNGVVTETITGGSGADQLTALGNGNTLLGNAGADTLFVRGNLTTVTGGAGADTFDVGFATTNVNSYASITDLTAGDKIKFTAGAADFAAASITLASTAVFQDFANAAINASDAGDVSWFQFGGDTYVVENVSNGASFANNLDIIVKVVGLVNLSTASFSGSADTLLVV